MCITSNFKSYHMNVESFIVHTTHITYLTPLRPCLIILFLIFCYKVVFVTIYINLGPFMCMFMSCYNQYHILSYDLNYNFVHFFLFGYENLNILYWPLFRDKICAMLYIIQNTHSSILIILVFFPIFLREFVKIKKINKKYLHFFFMWEV